MLGRILLTIDALGLLFGAIWADMNETHIYNPRWPPHAKFHNAQTITLSFLLGLATVYYTWSPVVSPPKSPLLAAQRDREALRTAAFVGSIYWLAGLASIMFPGTMGLDPEFGGPGFPQAPIFTAFMAMGVAGWAVERIGKA